MPEGCVSSACALAPLSAEAGPGGAGVVLGGEPVHISAWWGVCLAAPPPGSRWLPSHGRNRQAITALGFQQPTPIQKACIPVGLLGKDICACAATGTGKGLAGACCASGH